MSGTPVYAPFRKLVDIFVQLIAIDESSPGVGPT
jgi:hypothetical protein